MRGFWERESCVDLDVSVKGVLGVGDRGGEWKRWLIMGMGWSEWVMVCVGGWSGVVTGRAGRRRR